MRKALVATIPSAAASHTARCTLARTACATILVLAAAPASLAKAEPSALTITSPQTGTITNTPMPLIRGEGNLYVPGVNPVVLKIYR